MVRYLAAAERTGDWLLATAQRSPQGWSWPVQPGVSAEVEPGLGWGTAGPVMFFVEAFRTTGDERWLSAAQGGLRWMDAHLEESAGGWAGCGLLTGIGGWAVVLRELADAADDDYADRLARRVLETVAAHASVTDDGVHWHDLTEMVWGTAGIGCVMLALGADYPAPAAVDLAVRAGDWLLTQAEAAPAGIRWSLTWPSPSPWWTTSSTAPSWIPRACVGRTMSSGSRSPISRPRRPICRERPASAPRCCACTATWPGTRGPCAGRTPRPGPRLAKGRRVRG